MNTPPPPPPIEVTITPGCTPQAPVCVEIPQITATDVPASDAPPIRYEVRPVQVGGFSAGDEVHGHQVPDELLWAIWRWFSPEQQRKAVLITAYESGFDPLAVSPTDDHGVFQLNRRYIPAWLADVNLPPDTDIYDFEVQAQIASHLVATAGWHLWATNGVVSNQLARSNP